MTTRKVNEKVVQKFSGRYVQVMLNHYMIRERRESKGLTQAQAAEAAGMKSKQHWSNIENGIAGGERGVTLATLDAIAKALDCDPRALLTVR